MSDEIPDALSDALRKLVRRGNMTHLSVICSDGIFKAVYRGVDSDAHRHAESEDVVDALMQAVTGRRAKECKIVPPSVKRGVAKSGYEDLI